MIHQLPAGLEDSNGEFYASLNWSNISCLSGGKKTPFELFDESLLNAIEAEFNRHHQKVLHTRKMTKSNDRLVNLKQFTLCNYGGFDNKPDLIGGVLQPAEYVPCPFRGVCKFEGKVCDRFKTDTGVSLTARQVQITKLIHAGMQNKEIAGLLNISVHTVDTHNKDIRRKIGAGRKADIARYAHQNQLS